MSLIKMVSNGEENHTGMSESCRENSAELLLCQPSQEGKERKELVARVNCCSVTRAEKERCYQRNWGVGATWARKVTRLFMIT